MLPGMLGPWEKPGWLPWPPAVVFLGCVPPSDLLHLSASVCGGRRGVGVGGTIPRLAALHPQKMGSSPSPRTWEWPEWEVGSLQV